MTQFATSLFRLPGGRVLEWLECGDPQGYPLLFFHGYLGSVRQAAIVDDVAQREGLRIIAVNRPGIGRSSAHKYESMIDHAHDVLALARSLGIEEHAACGFSNGAGYALACAAAEPRRTTFVYICSPLGPLNMRPFFQELEWFRKFFFATAYHLPAFARVLAHVTRQTVLHWPSLAFHFLSAANRKTVDPIVLQSIDMQHAITDGIIDAAAFRDGPASMVNELAVSYNWGFTLQDILQPVHLWSGYDDPVTTIEAARAFADMLPNVRTNFMPGDHLLILGVLPNILESIAQRARELPLLTPQQKEENVRQHVRGMPLPHLVFQNN